MAGLILAGIVCQAQESDDENKAFSFLTLTGQERREKDFKLGPGMEVISMKGTNFVVPKGARVFDMGSWLKVEDLGEFLGRKFDEIETRMDELVRQQEQLKQELEEIKESLEEQNKKASVPE